MKSTAIIRRIVAYTGKYRTLWLVGVLLISASVFIGFWSAENIKSIVNYITEGASDALWRQLAVYIGVFLLLVVLIIIGSYCRRYAAAQAQRNMARDALLHVNRMPLDWMQKNHSGKLSEMINTDVEKSMEILDRSVSTFMWGILACIAGFIYLARINLPLTFLATVAGPVSLFSVRFMDKKIRRHATDNRAREGDMRGMMQEFFQAMPAARVLGLDQVLHQRFEANYKKLKRSFLMRYICNQIMWRIIHFVNRGAQYLIFFFVAMLAIEGKMDTGEIISFMMLSGNIVWPFSNISRMWGSMQAALGAAVRVFQVMDEKPEQPGGEALSAPPASAHREDAIHIENLCFSYDEKPVFDHFNLTVRRGENVAVVGHSGSGKSTLAKLCCGLYLPERGSVRIFGRSTAEDLYGARKTLAYVPQTPYVFAGSVKENILFGVRDESVISENTAADAAQMAHADEFVRKLESGYDAPLREHAGNLSGGQKQRIAIARAMADHAPLIIFDEATSALDNESEAMIRQTMEDLAGHSTLLIIAHRLTSVQNASRIIVLSEGKLVEEGVHQDLLARGGHYTRLYRDMEKMAVKESNAPVVS